MGRRAGDRKAEEGAHGGTMGDDDNAASRPSGRGAAGWMIHGTCPELLPGSSAVDREGVGDPACGLLRPYRE
jgi:hypothetical protein